MCHQAKKPGEIVPLSPENITELVHHHNEIRQNIIPTASNMRLLKWNETLAYEAGEIASNCTYMNLIGANIHVDRGNIINFENSGPH